MLDEVRRTGQLINGFQPGPEDEFKQPAEWTDLKQRRIRLREHVLGVNYDEEEMVIQDREVCSIICVCVVYGLRHPNYVHTQYA